MSRQKKSTQPHNNTQPYDQTTVKVEASQDQVKVDVAGPAMAVITVIALLGIIVICLVLIVKLINLSERTVVQPVPVHTTTLHLDPGIGIEGWARAPASAHPMLSRSPTGSTSCTTFKRHWSAWS